MSTKPASHRTAPTLAAALVLAAITSIARADCVDGTREATAAERDYGQRAAAALAALIPATPANMELRGKPFDFKAPPSSLGSLCKSSPKDSGWELSASAAYLFTWPKADQDRRFAERKQLLDQIAALEALPPEQAGRHQQLSEQARSAYNSQPKKARRSDPELSAADRQLAAQKVAEGDALDAQAKAIVSAHQASVKAHAAPLRARAEALQARVQELQVTFRMNTKKFVATDVGAATLSFGSPSPDGSLRASNIVAVVTGAQLVPIPPSEPRQALFDAIDQTRMRALPGKPLPSLAESEANAARQGAPR
jgi:hypothetical protein